MGEKTKIGWTGSTWNPWTGCDKASAGCDNCYMERWAARAGRSFEDVRRTSDRTFRLPLRLQERAEEKGERGDRVFVCSLSDFFHRRADAFRAGAWAMIRRCDRLIFQILTKRHGRIAACLPEGWGEGWPNVWLGVSVEDGSWLRRAEALCEVPADVRFLSMEPLIGRVDPKALRRVLRRGINWVIVGGESGAQSKVRPFVERDALAILEACRAEGVPCFVKQAGAMTRRLEGGPLMRLTALEDSVRPELLSREFPLSKAERAARAKAAHDSFMEAIADGEVQP